ncbi:hypothetical protein MVLG_01046 [Microbotryum lychnidis-dioicae p1A1 Lamole]|uniref:GH16 domain-containing protein n=1 Tax=Microbotryum lychnidis-dioicae (strain p1A1 Lamole / MvSl-1064) TaxID=683840 RepID=U5H0X9_USTV1|nr:hypothetical protein MVLG_01046 [Microbotryum lychnidis-dioicae p1A1 Lamole]|eukprot:KDE08956.1 hypothetical protein MVLG_01046 [Microbotryum lychnidis-dioicae p1A1 Lamole]
MPSFNPLPLDSPPASPLLDQMSSFQTQTNLRRPQHSPLNPSSNGHGGGGDGRTERQGSAGSGSASSSAESAHHPMHNSGNLARMSRSSTAPINSMGVRRGDSSTLDHASLGVLSGTIGGSFGPFPRSSTFSTYADGKAPFSRRDSMASSDVAIDLVGGEQAYLPTSGYHYSQSDNSLAQRAGAQTPPWHDNSPLIDGPVAQNGAFARHNGDLLWTKENAADDDYLHEPDPAVEAMMDKQWGAPSWRGLFNVGVLTIVIVVIVGLFAGWPIYQYVLTGRFPNSASGTGMAWGWGPGGINGSGQVPKITGLPSLIDKDTPHSVYTRKGHDGNTYNLVFSDEFNVPGRTFWEGDDPWWEAVDLWYWGTVDYEWYDPDAIVTKNGKLEITLTQEPIHGLNFRSGMLQSWNKFCFSGGGIIEVSMSMPGTSKAMGFWPGVWTMGNLGRPGYGASNHGMWPYTYNSCDVGTLPNQTWPNGTSPVAAKTSGSKDYGGELSYLPGQRASACTCPGEDHPGPNVGVGRGAPEIDINEMQVDYRGTGSTSQSIQFAPMDAGYLWKNTTPETVIYNPNKTFQNQWQGAVYQESASVITLTDDTSYNDAGYTRFSYEYTTGPDGFITWAVNDTATWTINAAAIGPNAEAGIGQRLISEEPMSIMLNLAISDKFQPPEWNKIVFPGVLRIDFVRVWQQGKGDVGCDPSHHPTADYINRHPDIYTNANLTLYTHTNYTWPKNRLSATGCN